VTNFDRNQLRNCPFYKVLNFNKQISDSPSWALQTMAFVASHHFVTVSAFASDAFAVAWLAHAHVDPFAAHFLLTCNRKQNTINLEGGIREAPKVPHFFQSLV
jgi:hypothetical protein